VRLDDASDGLDSQIIPLDPTRGCAQTGIYGENCYKWLPWVLKL